MSFRVFLGLFGCLFGSFRVFSGLLGINKCVFSGLLGINKCVFSGLFGSSRVFSGLLGKNKCPLWDIFAHPLFDNTIDYMTIDLKPYID